MYPTINQEKSKLFFCSNRENGSFDIFSIDLHSEVLLHDDLTSLSSAPILKESVLSSASNDKCPSINENLMVFTSDRPGGYGGYDLYYSQFLNNTWSSPVNFGEKINSSSDEYRPITFSFNGIVIMIFSSNRPGGKGGFDLYSAQIGDLLKNDDLVHSIWPPATPKHNTDNKGKLLVTVFAFAPIT
jgi:Tol biopolymer transport system component